MKKLDRFLLRDMISDGPAGTVYKAEEVLPGDNRRVVALKVLPSVPEGGVTGESQEERHFFGEVRVLAQLAVHPHVVTIYAMGVTDGYPWLAMEYAGTTLQGRMGDAAGDAGEVVKVLEHVARGLSSMHGLKPALIHQDIKPGNILVDQVGNYKVTDFSLATVNAGRKTHGLATVRYAAPELLSGDFGKVGPATDLYALGHIAYEMALGQRQHRQQFPAVFEGNTSKEPPPNKWMMWHASMSMKPPAAADVVRGFPPALSEVIGRLMAKQISQRYTSAEELLSDLSVLRSELRNDAGIPLAPAVRPSAAAVTAQSPTPSAPTPVPPPLPVTTVIPSQASQARSGSTAGGIPSASAMGFGQQYWVRLRGKVTGPFDLVTLQRQLKQGQISRFHQVSTDQQNWKQATEVEGLYGPTVV